jgi:hypothetical protein
MLGLGSHCYSAIKRDIIHENNQKISGSFPSRCRLTKYGQSFLVLDVGGLGKYKNFLRRRNLLLKMQK